MSIYKIGKGLYHILDTCDREIIWPCKLGFSNIFVAIIHQLKTLRVYHLYKFNRRVEMITDSVQNVADIMTIWAKNLDSLSIYREYLYLGSVQGKVSSTKLKI